MQGQKCPTYNWGFWHSSALDTYLGSLAEEERLIKCPQVDAQEIDGPTAIFAMFTLNINDVPLELIEHFNNLTIAAFVTIERMRSMH